MHLRVHDQFAEFSAKHIYTISSLQFKYQQNASINITNSSLYPVITKSDAFHLKQ